MKKNIHKKTLSLITKFALLFSMPIHQAFATIAGHAEPWQFSPQAPATPVARQLLEFHDLLLIIICTITAFVFMLLIYVMLRFNKRANPIPSKTSHNTLIEVIWTVIPVLILIVIVVPSMRLLYFMDKAEQAEMTLKVTGHQWYWTYEYPDHGKFSFDSNLIPENELKPGQLRLLEVNNRVVIPVDTTIRVLLTSTDVLHSWALPSAGIKTDTVPGRLNETWMRFEKTGVFYGQCSELCGVNHGFMPISVEVVSKEDFKTWVEQAKVKFASLNIPHQHQFASLTK